MFEFCEDIIDATEHLEKTVTTTDFENMHILSGNDEPKLIARKHDIVESLEFLREFQFNDNFTCGTFEIRILATIFNCEFLMLSIEQAENKTVQLKLKKETLKPYSFMKEYVDTSKFPAVKIVLFCEHNQKYFLLNKDTGPIDLTNTMNESLIPKVTVKMWLENMNQKSFTNHQLKEKDFDLSFLKQEDEEQSLTIAKFLDPLQSWEKLIVLEAAYSSTSKHYIQVDG